MYDFEVIGKLSLDYIGDWGRIKPLNMKILKIQLLSPLLRVTSPNNRFNTRFSGHICTTAHIEVAIRCFIALEHKSKDFDRLCVEQLNDA